MSYIRVHGKMNKLPIAIGKECLANVFWSLIELYNKQDYYKELYVTKQQLWELAGYKGGYNADYIKELIKELTKGSTYHTELNTVISGSMFVTERDKDGKGYKIYVPEPFRKHLFYKTDLDLLTKAKKNEKMSVKELDYYRNEVEPKKPFLMLLKKADIIGISGSYNKRLYAFLMQFKFSGKYFENYEKFKKSMEIPKSYRASDIDKQIFNKAKVELKKHGLDILKINKVKNGRNIQKIEIYFTYKDLEKEEKEANLIKKKLEILENEKNKEDKGIFKNENSEVNTLKNELAKKIMNANSILIKDKTHICQKLCNLNKVEDIVVFEQDLINSKILM